MLLHKKRKEMKNFKDLSRSIESKSIRYSNIYSDSENESSNLVQLAKNNKNETARKPPSTTAQYDVVQKHYPYATNAIINTFIKEWLRRAPEKCGKDVEVAAAAPEITNVDDANTNN
ncbi:uncharacterized protein [Mycetomoellerius zeteki]|uniref:uncharacterized protein n=1 Tax=Mycetomoellerius zeteki TaxID=64791 RepID=UPI00084E46F4|nr:PREDICTED: uncharacterized protein LOC108722074 [Trachymyrmex zeteki]